MFYQLYVETDQLFKENVTGSSLCDLILKLMFLNGALMTPIFFVFIFLGNCEFHFLASAGLASWICKSEACFLVRILKQAFLIFTQFFFVVHGISASFIQALIALPFMIFSLQLLEKYM